MFICTSTQSRRHPKLHDCFNATRRHSLSYAIISSLTIIICYYICATLEYYLAVSSIPNSLYALDTHSAKLFSLITYPKSYLKLRIFVCLSHFLQSRIQIFQKYHVYLVEILLSPQISNSLELQSVTSLLYAKRESTTFRRYLKRQCTCKKMK